MPMSRPVIVVHYHELWLKGRNRNFFLGKLAIALRRALEGIAFTKIGRPGDRMIVELGEGAPVGEALPGESSVHVVRELVRQLVPWQFTARLYLVPFEPLQREIVRGAPESYRLLLYRRLMLRIAERLATTERAQALVSGDSLGQVASQTLQNMVAVGDAVRMPVFRPLAGDDKLEILALARKIGTHDISAEPFHDCCPAFLPKAPALFASPEELAQAEAALDIP